MSAQATLFPAPLPEPSQLGPGAICGIDPGLDGAIAFIGADALARGEVWDMPTMAKSASKKSTKREVNTAALAALLKRMQPCLAYVELVNAMPPRGSAKGMGTASAFTFGQSFGVLLGVLAALEIPYALVHPIVWKKRAGIPPGSDKDYSRTVAQRLFPGTPLPLKKHVGRAEALLIAKFGGS